MKYIKINFLLISTATLLIALAIVPLLSTSGPIDKQLAQIKARGELRVGTLNSPLSYFTAQDDAGGFDYELAKYFADYLQVKLVMRPRNNSDELFHDLMTNQVDLLAASLVYDPERLKQARSGPAYYSLSQQLVYHVKSPPPKSLEGLKGKLVIASGSSALGTLKDLQKKQYPHLTWESTDKFSTKSLLEQVAEGKLDYTLADSMTIALMQRIHPQLAVAFDVTDEEPVTWYIKRGHTPQHSDDSLFAAMLEFYQRVQEEGTLVRLEEKYLGHVGSFDYMDTRTFLSAIDKILPVFRPLFEKHADTIDWKLLAAIAYQESHWDPLATSPTGVRGLMMLTRATAEGLSVKNRLDPEESIQGGALYLQRLIDKMPETIPEDERVWFALASYNMGFGHLQDVRQLTREQQGNPNSWSDVKQRLPLLSQKRYYTSTTYGYARGNEAYLYVENIRRYQLSLDGYLTKKGRDIEQGYEALAHVSSPYSSRINR